MNTSGSEDGGGAVSNEQLSAEIAVLKTAIARMVQANSIETVIGNGMADLAAMLEPLRMLRPPRTALERSEAYMLAAIHATLERPDYSSIEAGFADDFAKPNKPKSGGKKS